MFCGCGGSSSGAMMAARNLKLKTGTDIELKIALNHWKMAIETHQHNFPDTYHECTDVSACEPRRYASTDIFMASPECTNHSLAKGQKRVTAQLDLYDKGVLDPAAQRSRATMWDVPRFAEVHKYNIIIVENVVDARQWVMFDSWLHAMHALGYNHESVFLNSMFCHPTPQSRDRMYIVFWRKGNKKPNLNICPEAFCPKCEKKVNSIQRWKQGRKWGRYKRQYDYCCPSCGTQVNPYYYAAFNAIDWSDLGKRIGDRNKPLSPNTMRRIKYGIDKYSEPFQVINYTPGYSKAITDAMGTMTTNDHHAICSPFIVNSQFSPERDNRVNSSMDKLNTVTGSHPEGICTPFISMGEHSKTEPQIRNVKDAFQTQTTRQSMALIIPYIIDLHRTGKAKSAAEFIGTQTAGGINHALIVHSKGQSNSKPISDELGCITTKEYLGLITSEKLKSFLSYYYGNGEQTSDINEAIDTVTGKDRAFLTTNVKPRIEDCYYRMLKPNEIKKAMAFEDDFKVLGSGKDQVKQCGNAVTPPVMATLAERCIQTLL